MCVGVDFCFICCVSCVQCVCVLCVCCLLEPFTLGHDHDHSHDHDHHGSSDGDGEASAADTAPASTTGGTGSVREVLYAHDDDDDDVDDVDDDADDDADDDGGLDDDEEDVFMGGDEGVDADFEDDSELLSSVFKDISNNRDYVTMKDLLKWDLVFSLFAEGVLDEEKLAARMAALNPSNPQRMPIDAFDKFVDEMVIDNSLFPPFTVLKTDCLI